MDSRAFDTLQYGSHAARFRVVMVEKGWSEPSHAAFF